MKENVQNFYSRFGSFWFFFFCWCFITDHKLCSDVKGSVAPNIYTKNNLVSIAIFVCANKWKECVWRISVWHCYSFLSIGYTYTICRKYANAFDISNDLLSHSTALLGECDVDSNILFIKWTKGSRTWQSSIESNNNFLIICFDHVASEYGNINRWLESTIIFFWYTIAIWRWYFKKWNLL